MQPVQKTFLVLQTVQKTLIVSECFIKAKIKKNLVDGLVSRYYCEEE